ncbi:MAG: endolytic transglycosylase MltG [Flavobacteriales bacterium]
MKLKNFLIGLALAIGVSGAWMAWDYYSRFFKPNVHLDDSSIEFYIHSDWGFEELAHQLFIQQVIGDSASFAWAADYKKYTANVKPGRYIILDGMNNNQLVNLLRSGEQEPINVIVRSVRTTSELAATVGRNLEADSTAFMELINSSGFCQRYGFSPTTIITMFIPNTYQFYWNTSAEEFIERMAREYKRFWTDERIQKARKLGLSQSEVTTLASIVQAEQAAHPDERPVVAGLYLNRLRKGMRLESDPTLIHAIGDYTIKRVLNVHKEVDSPYNTYKNVGLPPGPILLPETSSIDAVLDAKSHNYVFMCAKEDFSGYHNFSSSYRDHVNNANRYRRALNQRKIYR